MSRIKQDDRLEHIRELKQQLAAAHEKVRFLSPGVPEVVRLTEENTSLRQQLADMTKERDDMKAEAHRYQWLRTHGLQRAWISLGTDCDGQNFADFKCEFKVPEPPNLPYEDDEGLEWADKDFDAAIDAAIAAKDKWK